MHFTLSGVCCLADIPCRPSRYGRDKLLPGVAHASQSRSPHIGSSMLMQSWNSCISRSAACSLCQHPSEQCVLCMQLQAWLNEMLNDLFEDMFRYKGIFSIKAEEGDDFEVVFQVGA